MRRPTFKRSTLRRTKPAVPPMSERLPQRTHRKARQEFLKLPSSKPQPLRTNRRGLFDWERWDGTVWKASSLRSYHNSHHFYIFLRTQKRLRAFWTESSSVPAAHNFWREYYAGLQRANQSIYKLKLHVVETDAIVFLLRTAPYKISKPIEDTLGTLTVMSYELAIDILELYAVRRILAYLQTNPSFFIGAVQVFQLSQEWRQRIAERLADGKIQRLERKVSQGRGWRINFLPIRRTWSDKAPQLHLLAEASWNASPIEWTIGPFKFVINALLRSVRETLVKVESSLGDNRRIMPLSLYARLQSCVDRTRNTGYEMSELMTELAALRSYRLHHFPSGSIEAEIEAGKLLWQQTQQHFKAPKIEGNAALKKSQIASFSDKLSPTRASPVKSTSKRKGGEPSCAPSIAERFASEQHYAADNSEALVKEMAPSASEAEKLSSYLVPWSPEARKVRTTIHGFIRWTDWNRTDWNVELLRPYKQTSCARHCLHHQSQNLRTLDERRNTSNYLLHYHQSIWEINKRLLPFVRLVLDINVTDYLLRSAPAQITSRLGPRVGGLRRLAFSTFGDILVLRSLSVALASLPLNPYYFDHCVRQIRVQKNGGVIGDPPMNDRETQRAKTNIASGLPGLSLVSNHDKIKALTAANQAGEAMKQHADAWKIESPQAVVEPLCKAIHHIATMLIKQTRRIRRMDDAWRSEPYRAIDELCGMIQNCGTDTTLLMTDLCALRYYRAYHFPQSVSTSELERGRALWKEVVTWASEGTEHKLPESLPPSGQSTSKRSAGALDSSQSRPPRTEKQEHGSSAPSSSTPSHIAVLDEPSSHCKISPSSKTKKHLPKGLPSTNYLHSDKLISWKPPQRNDGPAVVKQGWITSSFTGHGPSSPQLYFSRRRRRRIERRFPPPYYSIDSAMSRHLKPGL